MAKTRGPQEQVVQAQAARPHPEDKREDKPSAKLTQSDVKASAKLDISVIAALMADGISEIGKRPSPTLDLSSEVEHAATVLNRRFTASPFSLSLNLGPYIDMLCDQICAVARSFASCQLATDLEQNSCLQDAGVLDGSMTPYEVAPVSARFEVMAYALRRYASVVDILCSSVIASAHEGILSRLDVESALFRTIAPRESKFTELFSAASDMLTSVMALHEHLVKLGYVGPNPVCEETGMDLTSILGSLVFVSQECPLDYESLAEDIAQHRMNAGPMIEALTRIVGCVYLSYTLLDCIYTDTAYLHDSYGG